MGAFKVNCIVRYLHNAVPYGLHAGGSLHFHAGGCQLVVGLVRKAELYRGSSRQAGKVTWNSPS